MATKYYYLCANVFLFFFYAVAKDFLKIAEDTAAAATSDVPYAKERVAMMLTILKRFMVQAGASGKYHNDTGFQGFQKDHFK